MEIWKEIPGYEGKYKASNMGRIRSLDYCVNGINPYTKNPFIRRIKGRILKPCKYCKSGHVSVVLGRSTHGIPVHQLIMRTFVGKPPKGMEILHINGNPTDNRLENLRYGTRTDNILDIYRQGNKWRKLSVDDVRAIRKGLYSGLNGRQLAEMYNVSQTTISAIKRGRSFAWLK